MVVAAIGTVAVVLGTADTVTLVVVLTVTVLVVVVSVIDVAVLTVVVIEVPVTVDAVMVVVVHRFPTKDATVSSQGVHTRSDVAVASAATYSPAMHSVSGVHSRLRVPATGGFDSHCPVALR